MSTWTNWAGTVGDTAQVLRPRTAEELAGQVRSAAD